MDSIYGFSIFDGIGWYSLEKWAEIRAKEEAYLDRVYQDRLLKEAFGAANQNHLDEK